MTPDAAVDTQPVMSLAHARVLLAGNRQHAPHVLHHLDACRLQGQAQQAAQAAGAARTGLQQRKVLQHGHPAAEPGGLRRALPAAAEGLQAQQRADVRRLAHALRQAVLLPGLEQQRIQRVVQDVDQAARALAAFALFLQKVLGVVDGQWRGAAVQAEEVHRGLPFPLVGAAHRLHLARGGTELERSPRPQMRLGGGAGDADAEQAQQPNDLEVLEARAVLLQLQHQSVARVPVLGGHRVTSELCRSSISSWMKLLIPA